jgi:hypothetical protein
MPISRIQQANRLKPKEQRAIMARIRDRMNELGLGVNEMFGDGTKPGRSSISRTAWYSYESARRPVPMEALRELEQVLYLPAGELLKMAGWLPAGVDDFARSHGAVLVAIEVAPELTAEEKDALRVIYQGFLGKRRRRPQPST